MKDVVIGTEDVTGVKGTTRAESTTGVEKETEGMKNDARKKRGGTLS
jgi:hypothetical protein